MNKKQKEKFKELLSESGVKQNGVARIMELLEQSLIKEPSKPRAPKFKALMTLTEWEGKMGKKLDWMMFREWVIVKEYDHTVIAQLVEEFRIDMFSKQKEYADFRAAFQNYFNKGYLSIKPDNPKVRRCNEGHTHFERRGGAL